MQFNQILSVAEYFRALAKDVRPFSAELYSHEGHILILCS